MAQTKKKAPKSELRKGAVRRRAALKLELQIEEKPEQDWDLIEAESIIQTNWKKYGVIPQRGDFIADDGGFIYRIVGFQWHHDIVTIWLREELR